ncbi:MAG: squalene--hopene cyclase [Alphaproteobacteria bacterium]|nr:squalene--hopene cyclase [Alphaproteobacteria bacterium]
MLQGGVAVAAVTHPLGGIERLVDPLYGARRALVAAQRADGHWQFVLEADATITSEYVLLQHFLGEIKPERERRMARTLRAGQNAQGGWSLYADGDSDLSASVKAYLALKLAGDDPAAPHMRRARDLILGLGGAARANVFTRFTLALFGQAPWHAVPVMPVELMLLPRWFPFHLSKVSYWSRTVIVPLIKLAAFKPRAKNPRNVDIRELFLVPPEEVRDYIRNPTRDWLGQAFVALDRLLRRIEPSIPVSLRKRAIAAADAFITERLNGEDGLGGIFPAMANALMAMHAAGVPASDPQFITARAAIDKLVIDDADQAFCQPCLSPVWDTALAMHALMEAGEPGSGPAMRAAADWLLKREVRERRGDWSSRRPKLAPGGWAFQYVNDFYPDVDDSAAVGLALHRADPVRYRSALERTARWIVGMQSRNGGWGSFDADNTHGYLNAIPFADHGALLDPPTADVTARCIGFLAQIGYPREHPVIARGVAFLKRAQERDGSWFGRWGVNYIYGTWSVLAALNAAGEDHAAPPMRRAVAWLKAQQRSDGGWGEDCSSYAPERRNAAKGSTPSQTAWALLGLMAAGEVADESVSRGIDFLRRAPRSGVRWYERWWSGTGFPRVFYLKYHGYSAYFPLWALARYRRLTQADARHTPYGL